MSACNKDDVAIDRLLHPDANPHRCTHLVPDYTTNVADDYEVLAHIRASDDFDAGWFSEFNEYLRYIWLSRAKAFETAPHLLYEPGDYSRAALKVVAERGVK